MERKLDRLTAKWLRVARALGPGPVVVADSRLDSHSRIVDTGHCVGRCDPTLAEFISVSKELAMEVEKENPDVTPGF